MNNNSLGHVIKKINILVCLSFLTIILITFGIWFAISRSHQEKQKLLTHTVLKSTVQLFKSVTSQKLSLIANSPEFINYINSGPESRHKMSIGFLTLLSQVDGNLFSGMNIYAQGHQIFKMGKNSGKFITLNLCYLNQTLNSKYGDCRFSWQLFINKRKLMKKLETLNPNLTPCNNQNCKNFDFIENKNFGIFQLAKSTPIRGSFNIKQPKTYTNYLFPIFLFLTFILGITILLITNRAITAKIRNPLRKIIQTLKQGKTPTADNQIDEIRYLCTQISEYYNQKDKIEIAKIAEQAAHDIRSPLIALQVAIKNISVSEEEKELIKNATDQINDITNNLVKNHKIQKHSPKNIKNALLIPLIEKTVKLKSNEISGSHPSISISLLIHNPTLRQKFVSLSPNIFQVILSNILNNSIESFNEHEKHKIQVLITEEGNQAIIEILDDGRGIPDHLIDNVFKRGLSSKKSGSGLGLYHAKKLISEWGGQIILKSEKEKGTSIKLKIPFSQQQKWFCSELNITKNTWIFIVDDSKSIFNLWESRFKNLLKYKIQYFDHPESFSNWYAKKLPEISSDAIFLVDYNLKNDEINGLDILKSIHNKFQKILVTSQSEDSSIQKSCEDLEIKIIPKHYAPEVPINIITPPDYILIETDESLIHAAKFRADKLGINSMVINTFEKLMSITRFLSQDCKIYIDEKFSNEIERLDKFNFQNIFITSYSYKESSDQNYPTISKTKIFH